MYPKTGDQGIIDHSRTLFVDLIKWIIYASCIGIVVGLSTVIFLRALVKRAGEEH